MSDILEEFRELNGINEETEDEIELFHIFSFEIGEQVLYVTNDDKVFAYGVNTFGECGLGHCEQLEVPEELSKLSGQKIKQFFVGIDFFMCINEDKKVFSWGVNYAGQLGRGFFSDYLHYCEPDIIPSLENIIDISCGSRHCLALDNKGNVFAWGYNFNGQLGLGDQSGKDISIPYKLNSLKNIKTIYSFDEKSFAITFSGFVYSWGDNRNHHLGQEFGADGKIFEPTLIKDLSDVNSVSCSDYMTFFLTKNGFVYFCGKCCIQKIFQIIPKMLETELKFDSLVRNPIYNRYPIGLSDENIYIFSFNSIKKTEYKSFFDYFLNGKQTTFETVERGYHSGGFGTVNKIWDKDKRMILALKKIKINQSDLNAFSEYEKEVEMLSKCSQEYVVKYYNSWIDKNQFNIKMEYCSDNLENIIEQKTKYFKTENRDNLNWILEYLLSAELMIEIIECVDYLHELKPPIIHRDLKPANILINYQSKIGRHIKLCDFGLATYGSDQTITHTMWKGTHKYMAPEVLSSSRTDGRNRYSTKADVYSLGIIVWELFEFIKSTDENEDTISELRNVNELMLKANYKDRPTCRKLLTELRLVEIYKLIKSMNNEILLQSLIEYQYMKPEFFINYLGKKLKKLSLITQISYEVSFHNIEENSVPTVTDQVFNIDIDNSNSNYADSEKTETFQINSSVINEFSAVEQIDLLFVNISKNIYEFPQELKRTIKLFHMFEDQKEYSILYVTQDDDTFGLGINYSGKCGSILNEKIRQPRIIPELCSKKIKQFFIGVDFVFAINHENQVFNWGQNEYGLLCRGYYKKIILGPEMISSLKNITDLALGFRYCLALDSDGKVFNWGLNLFGYAGPDGNSADYNTIAVRIRDLPEIKSIYCFDQMSFAITRDGMVYSWGDNRYGQLGSPTDSSYDKKNWTYIQAPGIIDNITGVISVAISQYNSYIFTSDGNIHFSGKIDSNKYAMEPEKIETNMKFQALQSCNNYSPDNKILAVIERHIYEVVANKLIETKFNSLFDYCLNEYQLIFETIRIKNWYSNFKKLSNIGQGQFGNVIKVLDKKENRIKALKCIEMVNKKPIAEYEKEVEILKKCSKIYVAQYFNSWIDENELYIEMEFCSNHLKNIFNDKIICFGRQSLETSMKSIEYYISLHFMKEMVECVNYLHECLPSIIHRDLKPANFLLNYKPVNGRFIKLCDFGLVISLNSKSASHTINVGTPQYVAPEVLGNKNDRSKYNSFVDVYNFGKIFYDLFELDRFELTFENWIRFENLIRNMMNYSPGKRPTCSTILTSFNNLPIENLNMFPEYRENISEMRKYKNEFFYVYFTEKLNHSKAPLV